VEATTSFAADRARRTTQVDRWLAELLGAEPDVALVRSAVTDGARCCRAATWTCCC
jgi:hypothetical protein